MSTEDEALTRQIQREAFGSERQVLAICAVMTGDEEDARTILGDLSPMALHELMRVCLVTAGLAREAIVGATPGEGSVDDEVTRRAHLVLDQLERG